MSSSQPQIPSTEAIRTLRKQLGDDLLTFADLDAHFTVGYLIAWLRTNLTLEQLEQVVDELDDVTRVNGERVLGRRHSL